MRSLCFYFSLISVHYLCYFIYIFDMTLCESFLLVMARWQNTYIYKICKEKIFKEPVLNTTPIPDSRIKNAVLVILQIKLKNWSQSLEKLYLILLWYARYCNCLCAFPYYSLILFSLIRGFILMIIVIFSWKVNFREEICGLFVQSSYNYFFWFAGVFV